MDENHMCVIPSIAKNLIVASTRFLTVLGATTLSPDAGQKSAGGGLR
jgi:hypothetical protein